MQIYRTAYFLVKLDELALCKFGVQNAMQREGGWSCWRKHYNARMEEEEEVLPTLVMKDFRLEGRRRLEITLNRCDFE